ncbi:unnamed protein product [Phytophthora lilii]|uniref:Unnamed protein product n=1 Tax=Phytophthora lilii TaxID=2077276 RepID=A0A9W6WWL3_9STRA|nr:unnamed protein product [Phytophthora lilii]
MIRPVSHQQMQRVDQPRKPRVNAVLQSSSPLKRMSKTHFPKSPIKKHLQNALAFGPETALVDATTLNEEVDRVSSSHLHGPLKAKLRASVLQAVLRLLDQDVNALAGAHEVLQAAAALPLTEPTVQRACVQALREIQATSATTKSASFVCDSGSSSNTSWDAFETPIPPASPRKLAGKAQPSSSVRPTSFAAGSLHHCKEFLLACANEIHELEDDRPVPFDYAEDTSSSNVAQPSDSQPEKMCKHCGAANFDYASTVQESSEDFADGEGSIDDDDDDTRADQGSQFSDVLHRAEYMSDVGDASDDEVGLTGSMSPRDQVICRQVLQALHQNAQTQRQTQRRRSSAPNLATKFRVFEALKLQASLTRKRLAFQRLKTGLRSRQQKSSAIPSTLVKAHSSPSMRDMALQTLMLRHSDVLLLLLALVFLANLPAKYIM